MEYDFFPQEKPNFCIPACLQSLLIKYNFETPSQKEIFNSFQNNQEGVIFNEKNLNFFLENYNLKSDYLHPRESFFEIDFVLNEFLNKEDILTAFYYDNSNRHVTLLNDFKDPALYLHDPNKKINKINLTEIVKRMPLDGQCGFYFITSTARIPLL